MIPGPEADYADEFALALEEPSAASAESWARALFGDTPDRGQLLIFRGLLRLHLARTASPDTVVGFAVVERAKEAIRLQASSDFLHCHLIVRARRDQVSLTTAMQYTGRRAALIWRPLSIVHRRLAPGLLRDAEEEIRAAEQPDA
ncbi:hypothetical protein [Nesterenkonia sp. F]|uniref:hypothetical protein n=1 Tax=Nesterenkonia sp. F TaxID=795955 RepID=UPI000255CB54|nr:hypothetical protein [Nesterenkonia sp. F]